MFNFCFYFFKNFDMMKRVHVKEINDIIITDIQLREPKYKTNESIIENRDQTFNYKSKLVIENTDEFDGEELKKENYYLINM